MYKCIDCLATFKRDSILQNHKKQWEKCKRYKQVILTCRACGFTTVGIHNIDNHVKNCNIASNEWKYQNVENLNIISENKNYLQTLTNIENNQKKILKLLKTTKPTIKKLTKTTPTPKVKPKITPIVKPIATPIETPNVKPKVTPNVTPIEKPVVKAVVKKRQIIDMNDSEDSDNDSDDNIHNKKVSYRIAKGIELDTEKNNEEHQERIREVEEKRSEVSDRFSDIDSCTKIFEKCFDLIKQKRLYTKELETIRKTRYNLIGSLKISTYIDLINSHVSILTDIFKEKEYTSKKARTIIFKILNPIDLRLIRYEGYHNTSISIDDVEKIQDALYITTEHPKQFVALTMQPIYERFYNYGSVVIPIETLIKKYIINEYGYSNVIYVPFDKSSDKDSYSFYTLDQVKNNKRCWIMDCRLVSFSDFLFKNLMPYLVKTFRTLYFDIFHDNRFRPKFLEFSPITEKDCKLLLHNIFYISGQKSFRDNLRYIIKLHATYVPTELDKFNITSDDSLLKKKCSSEKDTDIINVCSQLFDEQIASTMAVDFYRELYNE